MRERLLKPRFFSDEDLAEWGPWHRLLFQGLWALADREGRLEDRPGWIRTQVFPFDNLEAQGVSVNDLLTDLARPRKHSPEGGGFITRYEVDGRRYLQVRNFKRHQRPHPKERPTQIPACPPVTELPRKATDKPRNSVASREKVRTSHSGPSVPSGPSGPSGPSEPSVNGSAPADADAPIPADPGLVKAVVSAVEEIASLALPKTPAKPAWNGEFADDYIAAYGGPPLAEQFDQVKRGIRQWGWERVRPTLRFYMAESPNEYVNLPKFFSALPSWEKRASGAPVRAGPKRPTVGSQTADVIREIARREGKT
jgi:hypothetical protein